MIKIELTFATADEALGAMLKLNGAGSPTVDKTATAKPASTKTKAADATTEAFEKPAPKAEAKAAPKTKAKAKAPSVDELKAHILALADDDTGAVKDFVASFGVNKISDMDDATRIAAFEQAEAFFTPEGAEDSEVDADDDF